MKLFQVIVPITVVADSKSAPEILGAESVFVINEHDTRSEYQPIICELGYRYTTDSISHLVGNHSIQECVLE